jgi:hypothetical protein
VHLVWYFFSKKRTCQQVRLCISRCTWRTHVIEGAPGLSIRRTWAEKKRAYRSAHRAWVSSNHQPDPQAHMWCVVKQSGPRHQTESPKRDTKKSAQGRLPQSDLPQ